MTLYSEYSDEYHCGSKLSILYLLSLLSSHSWSLVSVSIIISGPSRFGIDFFNFILSFWIIFIFSFIYRFNSIYFNFSFLITCLIRLFIFLLTYSFMISFALSSDRLVLAFTFFWRTSNLSQSSWSWESCSTSDNIPISFRSCAKSYPGWYSKFCLFWCELSTTDSSGSVPSGCSSALVFTELARC